jgi:small subunit ribosomal protein S29
LKFNETCLRQLPCQFFEPILLGEGAGLGMMQEADSMSMPEGSTLYDLIQTGITYSHAAVGVVVRLRKELSLVKDVPVLFAIDQVPQLETGDFILILHLMSYTADSFFPVQQLVHLQRV